MRLPWGPCPHLSDPTCLRAARYPAQKVSKTKVFETSLVFRDGMSKRCQPEPTERVPCLSELGEQNLCLLQILGVEAFGEPVIHRGEQLIGLLTLALALPQACEAYRCAQFPHFRLLPPRPVERGEEVPFSAFKITLER